MIVEKLSYGVRNRFVRLSSLALVVVAIALCPSMASPRAKAATHASAVTKDSEAFFEKKVRLS